MDSVKQRLGVAYAFLKRDRAFLNGSLLEYGIVAVVLTILTFIFTDWIVLHITSRLFVEGSGDGTSGFLWLNYADTDWNPLPGSTDIVNYPQGAHLGNPTYITYAALWVPLWILSRLFGSLAALNLVTMWGLFSGGFAMYWVIKRLTRNIWLSFFAAYAIAFVPYHIVNSSGHLAYIFSVVFVAILAAFIGFWRKPTWRRGALFAAAIALGYYTDGYFLLIGTVFAGTLVLGGLVYDLLLTRRAFLPQLWNRVKQLALAGIALAIFMIPIAYIQVAYGDKVNSDLAQARGDIEGEMNFYAARPLDYVVPPFRSVLWNNNETYHQIQAFKNSRSNASESTLYIGYALILPAAIGLACLIAYLIHGKSSLLNKVKKEQRQTYLFIACISLVSLPILFLFTMPPEVWLFAGHHWPLTPGAVLIKLDLALWRVLARFFLPIHVLFTAFSVLSIWALFKASRFESDKVSALRRNVFQGGIVMLLLGFITLEYAVYFNRPPLDFNNFPPAYTWLKQQKDIKVIAEFPLLAKPWDPAVAAVTFQQVHDKKLINLQLPQQDLGRRNGLVSIANPEAVDYAVDRGAQLGVTHDQKCNLNYPWLHLVYNGQKDTGHSLVCIYRLTAASSDHVFANLQAGFSDIPVVKGNYFYNMLYGNYAEVRAMNELDVPVSKPSPITFSATLFNTPGHTLFKGTWRILQDEKEIMGGEVKPGKPIQLHATVDGSKAIQLRIDGPNKAAPEVYQMSLQDIKLTAQ